MMSLSFFNEKENTASEERIRRFLNHDLPTVIVYSSVGSTNTMLKRLAEQGAEEGTLLIAETQTEGRGRNGKTYFSPNGVGIYMSVLLRPSVSVSDNGMITTCAAVAVCNAIEEVTGKSPDIKWVNDLYLDGKKICGILTEGAIIPGGVKASFAVVGIGINLYEPPEGYGVLQDTAGALLKTHEFKPETKCRLIAAVADRLLDLYKNLPSEEIRTEYKRRSFMTGKEVSVLKGSVKKHATVMGIDDQLRLIVRYDNDETEFLDSGEVSLTI